MVSVLVLLGAVALLSMMMSTREGRAEARARLRPYGRALALPVALIWAWIIYVVIR